MTINKNRRISPKISYTFDIDTFAQILYNKIIK